MTQQSECRIYNKKYHKYFYAVSSLETWSLGSTRYVLTKPPEFCCSNTEMKYSDRKQSAIWIFEPVYGRTNTFYLRNKKYNHEYLRASEEMLSINIFSNNLAVWSSGKGDQVDDEFFMWRFDRISNTDRYHIWNVKLGLPLSMTRYFKRQAVCLKNQPIEDLDMLKNFEWILKFLDDLNPII